MPLISVIVPIYKVEPYIRRCVNSILSQTFTDFELILVDDGSPDNCPAICDEYALKDSRIHVIHQENGGLSAARNAGLDYVFASSDSEWITFVDSDDWIHVKYLELLFNAAIESEVRISVCFFNVESKYTLDTIINDPICLVYDFEEFFCLEKSRLNAVVAWGKLYKKDLFLDTRYPVGRINEDLFVTPNILYNCGRIALTDATLYFYYQSDDSIMRRPWSKSRFDEIEAGEKLIDFMENHQFLKGKTAAVKRFIGILHSQLLQIDSNKNKDGFQKERKTIQKKLKKTLINHINDIPFSENK